MNFFLFLGPNCKESGTADEPIYVSVARKKSRFLPYLSDRMAVWNCQSFKSFDLKIILLQMWWWLVTTLVVFKLDQVNPNQNRFTVFANEPKLPFATGTRNQFPGFQCGILRGVESNKALGVEEVRVVRVGQLYRVFRSVQHVATRTEPVLTVVFQVWPLTQFRSVWYFWQINENDEWMNWHRVRVVSLLFRSTNLYGSGIFGFGFEATYRPIRQLIYDKWHLGR